MSDDKKFNIYETIGVPDMDLDGDVDAVDDTMYQEYLQRVTKQPTYHEEDTDIYDEVNNRFVDLDDLTDEELEYYEENDTFLPSDDFYDDVNDRYVDFDDLPEDEREYYKENHTFKYIKNDEDNDDNEDDDEEEDEEDKEEREIRESLEQDLLVKKILLDFKKEFKEFSRLSSEPDNLIQSLNTIFSKKKENVIKYFEWFMKSLKVFSLEYYNHTKHEKYMNVDLEYKDENYYLNLFYVYPFGSLVCMSAKDEKFFSDYFSQKFELIKKVFKYPIWYNTDLIYIKYLFVLLTNTNQIKLLKEYFNCFYEYQKQYISQKDLYDLFDSIIYELKDDFENDELYELIKDMVSKIFAPPHCPCFEEFQEFKEYYEKVKKKQDDLLNSLDKYHSKFKLPNGLRKINDFTDFVFALSEHFEEIKSTFKLEKMDFSEMFIQDIIEKVYKKDKKKAIKYFEWLIYNYDETNLDEKLNLLKSIRVDILLKLADNRENDKFLYNYLTNNIYLIKLMFKDKNVKLKNINVYELENFLYLFVYHGNTEVVKTIYNLLEENHKHELFNKNYIAILETFTDFHKEELRQFAKEKLKTLGKAGLSLSKKI